MSREAIFVHRSAGGVMPSASSLTTALARHAMSGKDMAKATAARRRGGSSPCVGLLRLLKAHGDCHALPVTRAHDLALLGAGPRTRPLLSRAYDHIAG